MQRKVRTVGLLSWFVLASPTMAVPLLPEDPCGALTKRIFGRVHGEVASSDPARAPRARGVEGPRRGPISEKPPENADVVDAAVFGKFTHWGEPVKFQMKFHSAEHGEISTNSVLRPRDGKLWFPDRRRSVEFVGTGQAVIRGPSGRETPGQLSLRDGTLVLEQRQTAAKEVRMPEITPVEWPLVSEAARPAARTLGEAMRNAGHELRVTRGGSGRTKITFDAQGNLTVEDTLLERMLKVINATPEEKAALNEANIKRAMEEMGYGAKPEADSVQEVFAAQEVPVVVKTLPVVVTPGTRVVRTDGQGNLLMDAPTSARWAANGAAKVLATELKQIPKAATPKQKNEIVERVVDRLLGNEAEDRVYADGRLIRVGFPKLSGSAPLLPGEPKIRQSFAPPAKPSRVVGREPPVGKTSETLLRNLDSPRGQNAEYLSQYGAESYNQVVSERLLEIARRDQRTLFTSEAWKNRTRPASPRSEAEAELTRLYDTWLKREFMRPLEK